MDFLTIDFETATAARDSACEVGLTEVRGGQVVGTRSWLVRPTSYPHFDGINRAVHGIAPEDVADAPPFDELWEELGPLVEGQLLIAHNAAFDMSVLRKSLEYYGRPLPTLEYACSYVFAKQVWTGLPSYGLGPLCRLHAIPLQHHRAGADSEATARLALLAFAEKGVASKEELGPKLGINLGRMHAGGYSPSGAIRAARRTAPIVGDPSKHDPDSPFYGRSVVFTGTMLSMTRSEAQQLVADLGGIVGNNVTGSTHYLVVGQQDYRVGPDGMSRKQKKANELVARGAELEVISEKEFLDAL